MPSEIRYHKSAENIEEAERATVKPLSVTYRRFTVLERVLMVVCSVFVVLAIVFGILYAASTISENEKNADSDVKNSVCKTNECVNKSSGSKVDVDCINTSSSIVNSLDWSVDPCHDFYNFSCNKWLSEHNIFLNNLPITQFSKLKHDIMDFFRTKLEDKETIKKCENIEAVSKALNYYASCMSRENVSESAKREQSRKFISDFGGWNISTPGWSPSGWRMMPNLIKIHRGLRVFPFFGIIITEDIKNSSKNQILMVQRANENLRQEMYLDDDPLSKKMRKNYKDLMLTVITMIANTSKDDLNIVRQIDEIFAFEKRLAEISMPTNRILNKEALYNLLTIRELQNATGNTFNWLSYFQGLFRDTGVAITMETEVNVNPLNYIKNMSRVLGTTDNALLANYMMWEVVMQTYRYFPRAVEEQFTKYKSLLWRVKPSNELWKTCFLLVKSQFGLPLSLLYLDEKFGEDKLQQAEEMVAGIRKVYVNDVATLSWMDPETKKIALAKARTVKQNIGFPKILLDKDELNKRYAKLEIRKDDYFGNSIRKRKFDMKEILQELSKPVDKSNWKLDPFDANAYYSKTENKIVITAGILQSPFFDTSRPMALNYGSIGMIIGHELVHSFDNKGRRYDEHGNLFNWWKNSSLLEFRKRVGCLTKQYSQYSYLGLKINGEKTLDENIADNGGIKQAFKAYEKWSELNREPALSSLNLTNNQLFFVGFAQSWCAKHRYSMRQNAIRTSHPPGKIRVNGVLSNYPEFSEAFSCPDGSRMNPKKKCNTW